jgi:hypothetical protein
MGGPTLDSAGAKVIGVPPSPGGLFLFSLRRLAVRLATSALSASYARVDTKPTMADGAGFVANVRHGGIHHPPRLRSVRVLNGKAEPHPPARAQLQSHYPKTQAFVMI